MLIRIPRIISTAAAVLIFGGALIATGATSPAYAHNYLASSTPEAGSTLTELPDAFAITTNDELLAVGDATAGFALQVVGADGLFYGDGCVDVAGPTMTSGATLGPAGDYTLTWQVISADGHSVSDQFGFTWAPASEADVTEGSATAPVCGETSPEEQPEEQEPEPQATGEVTPAPTAIAPDDGEPEADGGEPSADDSSLATTLWIGGVVVALAAAAVVTLLLIDRRRKA